MALLELLGRCPEMRATEPIIPGDIVAFTCWVTDKWEKRGGRLVECGVMGTN